MFQTPNHSYLNLRRIEDYKNFFELAKVVRKTKHKAIPYFLPEKVVDSKIIANFAPSLVSPLVGE